MAAMAILAALVVISLFLLFSSLPGLIVSTIKGWLLLDVIFVKKRTMEDAFSVVSKQLEQVSTSLDATEGHLTERLEKLDDKLDAQTETVKLVMNEVTEFKIIIGQNQFAIESIRKMMSDMMNTIELLEAKQDMALQGIVYLCNFADGAKDGIRAKHIQEARNKLELASRPSSTFSMNRAANLEGLKFIAGSMKIGDT